jgi:hypothetical protein
MRGDEGGVHGQIHHHGIDLKLVEDVEEGAGIAKSRLVCFANPVCVHECLGPSMDNEGTSGPVGCAKGGFGDHCPFSAGV